MCKPTLIDLMDTSPEKSPYSLEMEDLAKYFHLTIAEAAQHLGVCTTFLKKLSRKKGIERWPHRKIKSLDLVINSIMSQLAEHPEDTRLQEELQSLKSKKEFIKTNPNIDLKTLIPKSSRVKLRKDLNKLESPIKKRTTPQKTETPMPLNETSSQVLSKETSLPVIPLPSLEIPDSILNVPSNPESSNTEPVEPEIPNCTLVVKKDTETSKTVDLPIELPPIEFPKIRARHEIRGNSRAAPTFSFLKHLSTEDRIAFERFSRSSPFSPQPQLARIVLQSLNVC